jgi:TM2 domain-containing membrane protein YozV
MPQYLSTPPAPPQATPDVTKLMLYDSQKKSTGTSYLLFFLFGGTGAHRFYLGSTAIGALLLACLLAGFLTAGLTWILSIVILIVDLFSIPSFVRRHNHRVISALNS